MPVDHLAFDIETVPNAPLESYSASIRENIRKKIERMQDRNPDYDFDYFASTHGDFGKIICISMGYIQDGQYIRLKSIYGEDEYGILEEFNAVLAGFRGLFIHYNGIHFDVPFILQRMAHHGIAPANPSFTNLRRYQTQPHFDLMMVYYNWDMQRALPLGILAELYHIPSPKEDLSGSDVLKAYRHGEWERIVRYCEFDVATTLNLWQKIFQQGPVIPLENYLFSKGT
ncbi:MAG: hypothetical protein GXO78_05065 [Calditrichaeota bacterium]|nr:hypothetical protein [Calditrichota bacterium]